MNRSAFKNTLFIASIALGFALVVASLADKKDAGIPVEIVGYNHTDTYIHSFGVNGYGGSNVFPHGGGGSFVCCVVIPREWRPGLKATVRWMNPDDSWNETLVEIPQYLQAADFQVHFMRDHKVRVFVFDGFPGTPGHPLQGKEAEL